MAVNRCVLCGAIIPEGDHVCNQCFKDTSEKKILVTDEMLQKRLDPVMLSFNDIDVTVRIENSVLLLENLVKYYVFKTNMNAEGNFTYRFVYTNTKNGENIVDASYRLLVEYSRVVHEIERMIIKK